VLLNWRGPPFSYRTVSFADVFNDMLSRDRKRPPDEFTGKIVLVGSTAPSLFDTKPTPMASLHPGVEILATAIDNLMHDDYLRFPEGRILYPLIAALIVWAIALTIYRDPEGNRIDRVVATFQFVLLATSYASINLTHTYVNLTGPFSVVLAYYAVARLYGVATRRVLETSAVRDSAERVGELGVCLLLVRADASAEPTPERRIRRFRDGLVGLGAEPNSVDLIEGSQKGIWSLFEHTLAISWIFPTEDSAARSRAQAEIGRITAAAAPGGREAAGRNALDWYAHEGRIPGGEAAAAAWTGLFAEALVGWQRKIQRDRKGPS
jgi:hypothetical protein